jgi:electron transport complex protein RnfG
VNTTAPAETTAPDAPAAPPPPANAPEEPGTFRLITTLAVAGLLSGLILAFVYLGTAPRIAAQQEKRMREAVLRVLPGATGMREMGFRNGALVPVNEEAGGPESGAEEPAPGGTKTEAGVGGGTIYAALNDTGEVLGYAIPAEGPGFQDVIRLIYGFDPDRRRIVGMQVLESRETPGLGDRIYKDPDFAANFKDLAVEPAIRAVKKGTKSAPNEIDAITGATISSKSVVNILNAADEEWLPRIPAGEGETP